MKKMNRYIHAVISGYMVDQQSQIITIIFSSEGLQGNVLMKTFPYRNGGWNGKVYNFLRNLPAFTKNGELDLEWLEGTRVYIGLSNVKNNVEVITVEYDYSYYAVNPLNELTYCHDEEIGG